LTGSAIDLIATDLADTRTKAATGSRSAESQRIAFRAWVARSASLLRQLHALAWHRAATTEALGSSGSLTPMVDAVGNTLLRLKDIQGTSQRAGQARLIVHPDAPLHFEGERLSSEHSRALAKRGVRSHCRGGTLIALLPGSLELHCRLDAAPDGSVRLVLEAAEPAAAGAVASSSAQPESIMPPFPPLLPMLRYWISRLHEVVSDAAIEAGGASPARSVQLQTAHALLSDCLERALLQHTGAVLYRLTRSLPVSAAARAPGDGKAGGSMLLRRPGSRTLLTCTALATGILVEASWAEDAEGGARTARAADAAVQSLLGDAVATRAAGLYVYTPSSGVAPLHIGRGGILSSPDFARLMLSLASPALVSTLLASAPTFGTVASSEPDARAFDSNTGRSVPNSAAVRPLPPALHQLLLWMSDPAARLHTAPRAAAEAGAEAGGHGGSALTGGRISEAFASAVINALAELTDARHISRDFAAVSVHSVNGGTGGVVRNYVAPPLSPPRTFPLRSAAAALGIVRDCRKSADTMVCSLAASLLAVRPDCVRTLRAACCTPAVDTSAGTLVLSLYVPGHSGPFTLALSIDSDARVSVATLSSLPPAPASVMAMSVLTAMQAVADAATARLSARRTWVASLLCRRRASLSNPTAASAAAGMSGLAGLSATGHLADVTLRSVLDFGWALGSPVSLASCALANRKAGLGSVLLHVLDAESDMSDGAGVEPLAGLGEHSITAGPSAPVLLGAPLAEGIDAALVAAIAVRTRHDAEMLALLALHSHTSEAQTLALVEALRAGIVAPSKAIAALETALAGDARPGVPSPPIDRQLLRKLVEVGSDATAATSSQLYAALRPGGSASARQKLQIVQTAVSRKMAAVHATALAEASVEAIAVVLRLLPLQAALSSAVQRREDAPAAPSAAAPLPLFLDSVSEQGSQGIQQPWACMNLGTAGRTGISIWLMLGLDASGKPVAQHSAASPVQQIGGCRLEGSTTSATALTYGMCSLTRTEGGADGSEALDIAGSVRWATAAQLASVSAAAPLGRDLRVSSSAAAFATPGPTILVVECAEETLAPLCTSANLAFLLEGGGGSEPARAVHRLLAAVSAVGGSAGAVAVVLLPPLSSSTAAGGAPPAPLLPRPQGGFVTSVLVARGGAPVLWAHGAAAAAARRAFGASAPAGDAQPRAGPAGKASMFRSSAQPLRTAGAGGPLPLAIRLPAPRTCERLHVCLAHRLLELEPAGAAGVAGAKRSRQLSSGPSGTPFTNRGSQGVRAALAAIEALLQ
jgi:hypothetical protein